jgi:hypothetical protein
MQLQHGKLRNEGGNSSRTHQVVLQQSTGGSGSIVSWSGCSGFKKFISPTIYHLATSICTAAAASSPDFGVPTLTAAARFVH